MKSSNDRLDLLLRRLDFSPDNVVEAAAEQPGLFLKAAEYRIAAFRKLAQSKMDAETQEASASLKLRQKAKDLGDRITENNLADKLAVNDDIKDIRKRRREAEEQEEWAKLLLEAFRMRKDCLWVVGNLMREERAMKNYLDEGNQKLKDTRERLKAKYPGAV